MNLPHNSSGSQGSTPPTESSEQSHFFVCSGNPSIIRANYDLLCVGARAHNGACGHYFASAEHLNVLKQEAREASLPFVGKSYMGSNSEPVSHMHEVWQVLEIGAGGSGAYIAYVSVEQTGVSWVHKTYDGLLGQAVPQGILPYDMYVTKDEAAAQLFLGSVDSIS